MRFVAYRACRIVGFVAVPKRDIQNIRIQNLMGVDCLTVSSGEEGGGTVAPLDGHTPRPPDRLQSLLNRKKQYIN